MTLVKVCGIKSREEAQKTAAAGADLIGLVFAAGSPRTVSVDDARAIVATLRGLRPAVPAGENARRGDSPLFYSDVASQSTLAADGAWKDALAVRCSALATACASHRPLAVGVFAGMDAVEIETIAAATGIDVIQLSGAEEPSLCGQFRVPVVKAVHVHPGDSADAILARVQPFVEHGAAAILLDTGSSGAFGGTGQSFDWTLAKEVQEQIPIFVAGGLGPQNVAAAIAATSAFAVDASSGLEHERGIKDISRIQSYIAAARFATSLRKFGAFGGQFVPETLMGALRELEESYAACIADPAFHRELEELQRTYVGRPTPLYFARRLTEKCGGARIWLKREDLAHTGAHKINNALGQALVARRLGKPRIIAETGAGQHGVASATACALLGLDLTVYMGAQDVRRQSLNVFRMKLLGAKVVAVESGAQTLKDAINEAMRDWVTNVETTHYLVGSAIGPHPFPTIVRDFQRVIGIEAREQMLAQAGKLPDAVVACVGGGSNAIGIFHRFIEDSGVELVGVEAGGHGVESGRHSATLSAGQPGVFHGTRTYLLQDAGGQVVEPHSISAGLDYPGVGPEHAHLKESGRATYVSVTDQEALDALVEVGRLEGITPALEPAHAFAYALRRAGEMSPEQDILVHCCGRGDKDMHTVSEALGVELFES